MVYEKIHRVINAMDFSTIPSERKEKLLELTNYIQSKLDDSQILQLNFICTHNSRRSQFAQAWATVAGYYYTLPVKCYSGGTEVTAFHPNAVEALTQMGFSSKQSGDLKNPIYTMSFAEDRKLKMFSKTFDGQENPKEDFAAVMTCAHADSNCPMVFGAEARIALTYDDPKRFDNTPLQRAFYTVRSFDIATELFFAFSQVKQ